MNAARILILVAAGLAAIAAAYFVYRSSSAPEPQVIVQQQEVAPTVRVLSARNDLETGSRVTASDLYWQAWPEEAVSPVHITESRNRDAIETYSGAIVRADIAEGEPISPNRLIATGDASFMSAMLGPGMRAVAVPISAETGAGGFILPNDRVDVIVTFENEAEGNSRRRFFVAETVVENARVLAIDQAIGGDDEDAVVGSTATLELAPDQARAVALAVARGDISLMLRSLSDGAGGPRMAAMQQRRDEPEAREARDFEDDNTIQVYRYGQGRQVALQGD